MRPTVAARPTIVFRAKQAISVGAKTWVRGARLLGLQGACLPSEEPRRFDCPGTGRHRRPPASAADHERACKPGRHRFRCCKSVRALCELVARALARAHGAMDVESLQQLAALRRLAAADRDPSGVAVQGVGRRVILLL